MKMTLPSHRATLHDQGLRNWVLAGIGLEYTKEGLESFIDNEAVEFHNSLIKKLKHSTNLTSDLREEIVSAHRFGGPSWKNSDQMKWLTDHWEVAKNYLPNTGGYKDIPSATATDCIGLLNIGINLSEIATRHNIPLDFDGDPPEIVPIAFSKCRTARNKIMHCESQSLTDLEVKEFLSLMKDTLQCTTALQIDAAAKLSVTKLTWLEISAFKMTDENITKVCQMSLKAIQDEGKKFLKAIRNRIEQILFSSLESPNDKNTAGTDKLDASEPEAPGSKTNLKPHPGRIVSMEADEIEDKIKNNELEYHTKGGFGKIYKSKTHLFGLKRHIVVKETDAAKSTHHRRSVCNEKLASHLYHFAIVPTLAWAESDSLYYFLYPYMEIGDLYSALDKHLLKTQGALVRILMQVASAIDFLHKPVDSYRGAIIHSDITSKNIVLDKDFNARLTDFGLSRDQERTESGTLLNTDGYYIFAPTEKLTVKADYFNFGVVCRECLTGKKPVFDDRQYLHKVTDEGLKMYWEDFNKYLTDEAYTDEVYEALAKLSENCLNSVAKDVLQLVKEIFERKLGGSCYFIKPSNSDNRTCLLCMVNEAEADTQIFKKDDQHQWCRNMVVCIKCQQNSYINPIICCDCLEEITSMIGKNWCALLLAGNASSEEKAQSFIADMETVNAILLSKIPTIIGMDESRVALVTPSIPGKEEEMTGRVKDAFKKLKEFKPKTFLFYYSGDKTESSEGKAGSFQLGSESDVLAVKKDQEKLDSGESLQGLLSSVKADKYFIFLDCCFPLDIEINEKQVFQIHPESNKRALAGNISPFTEAFTLGLSGNSGLCACPFGNSCDACNNHTQKSFGDAFITVLDLFKFIRKHVQVPELNAKGNEYEMIMAYFINKKEDFMFNFKNIQKDGIIPADFRKRPKKMEDLKKVLLNVYKEEFNLKMSEKSTGDISDAILIFEVFGPKKNHRRELKELKQVQEAHDAKSIVEVDLRRENEIVKGKVAKFENTNDIRALLETNAEKLTEKQYRIRKDNLHKVYLAAKDNNNECRDFFKTWWTNQGICQGQSVVFNFYQSDEDDFYTFHIENSE